MKKLILLFFVAIFSLWSQPVPRTVMQFVASAPAGACASAYLPIQYYVTTGVQYGCVSSSWAVVGGVGGITGTGVAGRIGYWSGTTTLTGAANFVQTLATTAPVPPVLATAGTPGAVSLSYKLVYRTPHGVSLASTAATITTAHAVLDGTNYVTVTAPACTGFDNTTVDVWLTVGGGNVPTKGYLTNIACAGVYSHQGLDGDGLDPGLSDTSAGLYTSLAFEALGSITGAAIAGTTITASSTIAATGTITGTAAIVGGFFQGGGSTPSVSTCGTIGAGSKNAAGFITTVTGACVPLLTFASATATTGWSCSISNSTTPANIFQQTGSSTTTATFTGTSGATDIIRYTCIAY